MRQVVPRGALVGFLGALVLLGALNEFVGLGAAAWAVGVACAAALNVLLARGLLERGQPFLGPADRVTLTRSVLTCGVAALTAAGFEYPAPVALFVGLSAVALSLDAVDGRVARRTGTASALGARFDMEADAFLILVLSVHVAPDFGWWVLAGGAARYALVVATWLTPWLRRQVPARRWRKLVAGLQGVVLAIAASQVLPHTLAALAIVVGLTMLAVSFGTQVASLWRIRSRERAEVADPGWVAGQLTAPRVQGVPCQT